MKNNMPGLFNLNIEDPDEVKASKFISKLQSKGFVGKNMIYLQNYINADMGIAFAHIKNNYKTYVCKGSWTEKKFEEIIYVISKDRQMLIPNVFLRYGVKYDEGKLNRDINIERKKYEEKSVQQKAGNQGGKQISKEEQELLDYIAQNGGL